MEQTVFNDCGLMIYDREKQPYVVAGEVDAGALPR